MLEPREVALLQALTQGGRATADQARALAQAVESARAGGARVNVAEMVVARRLATNEEIDRFLRSSGRVPQSSSAAPAPPPRPQPLPGWNSIPPEDAESPTIRQFATERFPAGTAPLPIPGQPGFAPGASPAGFSPPPPAWDGPTSGSGTRSDFVSPVAPPSTGTRPDFPAPIGSSPGSSGTRSDFAAPGTRPDFPAPIPPTGPTGTMRDPAPFGGNGFQPSEPFRDLGRNAGPGFTPADPPGVVSGDGDRTTNSQGLGPFRFEARLGDGRSGTVFRARHSQKDRLFAVKLLNAPGLQRSEVDRLLREARSAQWLRHPNIVVVHEVGESPGGPSFVVEDFIEGPSLAQEIAAGNLDARGAARIVSRIALALQSAHDQGIVHRDVKPGNVLLDSAGEPFLSDFGLAREVSLGDKGGRLIGTPEYSAPEQATGEGAAPSRRSDVYSLGAMLFECLTGRPPFVGDSPAEVARQVVEKKAPRARKLEPSVPADLEAVCDKALAKRPEERYATARELAEDLRRFLDGRPVQARPAKGAGLPGGTAALVVGAALAALALVGSGAGGVLLWRKHELERRLQEIRAVLATRSGVEAETRAVALLRDEPGEPRAHALLAEALLLERRESDALEHAKIAAAKEGAAELVVLGLASVACDKPDDARAAWEKAVASPTLEPSLAARASVGLANLPGSAPDSVRAHVQRATTLAPEDPEIAAACAQALLQVGDPRAALAQLEKARAARPKDEELLATHGLALAISGEGKAGLAEIDQALATRADLAMARLARARVRLSLGECAGALEDAEEARHLGVKTAGPLVVAAVAKAWLGARDDAQLRLGELEKAAPTGLPTAIARSQVLALQGKTEDAAAALGEGGKGTALLGLALKALLEKGTAKIEAARADAEQALAQAIVPDARWVPPGEDDLLAQGIVRRYGLSSPEPSVHAIRAEVLLLLGRAEEAQRELDLAKRAKDAPPRLSYVLALLARDLPSAVALIDQTLQAAPDLLDARGVRASLRIQLGQPQAALEDLKVLVKLEPMNVQHRLNVCNADLLLNDWNAALAALDDAERASPRPSPIIASQKAMLLTQGGKPDEALRVTERVLQTDPANPECRFWHGVARFRMGDAGFDEDLQAAIKAHPEQLQWHQVRIECLLGAGRVDESERNATAILDAAAGHLPPNQLAGVRMSRAQARLLLSRGRECLEDLRAAAEGAPELANQASTIALRAMARAMVGDPDFGDDVKALAQAQDPRAQEAFAGPSNLAFRFKTRGPWERAIVVLADVTQRKELKPQLLKLAAYKARALEEWAELAAYAKKLDALKPGDPDTKQLLELARQHGQAP